jgi:hypothetical protein
MKWAVTRSARFAVIGSLGLWLLGCATPAARPRADQGGKTSVLAAYVEHASKPAAALVFSPPLLQETPPLALSRDERQASAFMGYPESVVEFFYLRWDDRQAGGDGFGRSGHRGGGGGWGDRYERRAISEKVGVLYR